MARKQVHFNVNPLLSGPSLKERTRVGSPYRLLPVADIEVDPGQPRKNFDTESLAELAASIKEYGVLCPILVRLTEGGGYCVVAGERRLRASRLVGLESIPVIVNSEEDEANSLAKQLVENLQREDLSPLERAIAIGELRDNYSWSIREIAKKLGVSKGLVQRSLEILNLPDDLQSALSEGASESKILMLAKVEDSELRRALLDEIDKVTRKDLELEVLRVKSGEIKGEKGAYRGGTSPARATTSEDEDLVQNIQKAVGTRVYMSRAKTEKGRGKLVIEFYSPEDLRELYRKLTG